MPFLPTLRPGQLRRAASTVGLVQPAETPEGVPAASVPTANPVSSNAVLPRTLIIRCMAVFLYPGRTATRRGRQGAVKAAGVQGKLAARPALLHIQATPVT